MMNFRSIRFRLTAWYAGLLALLLLIFSVTTYAGLERYLAATLRESLTRRAKEIGPMLADMTGDGASQIIEIESRYAPEADNGFLRISRIDGTVIFVSGQPRDLSFDPPRVPLPQSGSDSHEVRIDRIEHLANGGNLLISTFHVNTRDGTGVRMEIGSSDRHIRELLNELLLVFALALPLSLGIAISGGYLLTRRALKPIGEITSKAESITSRNLSERLPVPETGDEVERLSASLNGMIERLEKAFHYVNRFSADASHELRTPLTIVRGELESIAQQAAIGEHAREEISSALEETERLTRITESLLIVSRLDAGEVHRERNRFDLAYLALSTAEQMRLLAEDKNISLLCDFDSPVEIEGDAERLKQVIVNLLDNAIKYTPKDGQVSLTVKTTKDCAVLEMSDSGQGIHSDSLPHIFERFYRADRARTRRFGGVGLGLAIAQSICRSHGGEITVESSIGQGSRFRVELPLPKPEVF